MEKLIELIWEWQKETHPDGIYLPVVAYRDWIFWSDWDCLSSVMDEIHLISKPCHFIKWLVKNDKINLEKLRDLDIADNFNYEYFNKNKSDFLISLLSISETPIELLISILK